MTQPPPRYSASDPPDYVPQRRVEPNSTGTARDTAAQQARDLWAREHGCRSFSEAMTVGIQIVANRARRTTVDPVTAAGLGVEATEAA